MFVKLGKMVDNGMQIAGAITSPSPTQILVMVLLILVAVLRWVPPAFTAFRAAHSG